MSSGWIARVPPSLALYMEKGLGATHCVSFALIHATRQHISDMLYFTENVYSIAMSRENQFANGIHVEHTSLGIMLSH